MKSLLFFIISSFLIISYAQCHTSGQEFDFSDLGRRVESLSFTQPSCIADTELAETATFASFAYPQAPPSTPVDTAVVTVTQSLSQASDSCCNFPVAEIWLGRAFRILGKPLVAAGAALAFESITAGDMASPMAIGGVIAAAAGGFMNTIGKKIEARGMRQAAEKEASLKHLASPQTPAEVRDGADSFLAKDREFRACDVISAKVYGITGTVCSILGQPLAIIGGITYIYGHNSNNSNLTNIGIGLGTTGVTLDTLGSELEKLAKEREDELERFEKRDKVRTALRAAREPV